MPVFVLISSSVSLLLPLGYISSPRLRNGTILTLPPLNTTKPIHVANWPPLPYTFPIVSQHISFDIIVYDPNPPAEPIDEILDDLASIATSIEQDGTADDILPSGFYKGKEAIVTISHNHVRVPDLSREDMVKVIHKLGGCIVVFGPVGISMATILIDGKTVAFFRMGLF